MAKIAYHPTIENLSLSFKESDHSYIDNRNNHYVSVTTFIKTYFPKFKSEIIAKRIAKKRGINTSEVLAEWDNVRNKASAYGTKVHLILERGLRDEEFEYTEDFLSLAEITRESIRSIVSGIKEKYDLIKPELILFSPGLGISGTMDLLIHKSNTDEYLIIDWKTNREIQKKNKYKSFGFGPAEGLADVNFIHYSLQISMYKHLLLREGYIPSHANVRGYICHLSSAEDSRYQLIPIKNMDKEIELFIANYLANPNSTTVIK